MKRPFHLRLFLSLPLLFLLGSCSFTSKGTVVVSGNCQGCTQPLTDDAVALVAAAVLEQHGLLPVWSTKASSGPCTAARGCSWAPEGKGWLQPWVLVASPSSGQVRITIETRQDAPGRDDRVIKLTEEVAGALNAHFGSGNVAIEKLD